MSSEAIEMDKRQQQLIKQRDQIILGKVMSFFWKIARGCLVIGISFIILYPIFMKISTSFKNRDDIYNPMVIWIPQNFTLENWSTALEVMNFSTALKNSVILSSVTMIMAVISCALAGYGFARFKFKGNNVLFALVILTILVPTQTLVVPLYMHFRYFDILGIVKWLNNGETINMINTYWPIIMTNLTANGLKAGLFIYIFRQFFKGMPGEIEEAAIIDGAGVFKTFFKVMLPNAVPAIITVLLFAFVWQYNDVLYSNLFLTQTTLISSELGSIGGSVEQFINVQEGNVEGATVSPVRIKTVIDTGILLAIMPLIIMYVFVQRWFVESVERTGIVG